jgi:hypothetical protein
MTLASIRQLVADDAHALTFQTFGQYRTALLKAIDQASPDTSSDPARDLAEIYDAFRIGAAARSFHILRENLCNVLRREQCLAAIERTFFMVPTEPEEEDDGGPGEECLLSWGQDPDEYVRTFREALKTLSAKPAESVCLVATGEIHEGQLTYTRHDVRPPLCDTETLYTHPSPPAKQEQVRTVAQAFDAFLCRAWGETDLASAELVTDWEGVRRFMVREWLGEVHATNDDDSVVLDQIKIDFEVHEEEHNGRGGAYEIEFEIGGVSIERVCAFAAPAAAGEQAPICRAEWIAEAKAFYIESGDDEATALECAKQVAREQNWLSDELDDPRQAAQEDIHGRPRWAPSDESILALNAGERFFSESPSRYPEARHGTQYHAGKPGVLQFARAVLSLASREQDVPKWIDDPHDIEQGQMLNPAWLKLHGLTAVQAAGKESANASD